MSLYAGFDKTAQLITFNYSSKNTVQRLGKSPDSTTSPAYSWDGDTGLGIYRAGTNILGLVTASTERMRVDSTGLITINQTTGGGVLSCQVNGSVKLYVASNGNVGINTSIPTFALHSYTASPSASAYTPNIMGLLPMAIIEERHANGTVATSIASGTFTKYRLNTAVTDSLGVTVNLNNNEFTLPIGVYYIMAEGTFFNTSGTVSTFRIFLTTGATPTITLVGTNMRAPASSTAVINGTLSGIVSITSATTYNLQAYTSQAGTLGSVINQTSPVTVSEVYARITIIRYQ